MIVAKKQKFDLISILFILHGKDYSGGTFDLEEDGRKIIDFLAFGGSPTAAQIGEAGPNDLRLRACKALLKQCPSLKNVQEPSPWFKNPDERKLWLAVKEDELGSEIELKFPV